MAVFLCLNRSRGIIFEMRNLLVIVAEIVVLNELQLVLLRSLHVLRASLASLPLLSFLNAFTVFFIIFETELLLVLYNCIRW